jgi:hypothetical protein
MAASESTAGVRSRSSYQGCDRRTFML